LRPSFSISSLSQCASRFPRLTLVSEGKPLRRLLMTSKPIELPTVVLTHDFVLLANRGMVAGSARYRAECSKSHRFARFFQAAAGTDGQGDSAQRSVLSISVGAVV
jgi:hypothetical protein